MGIFKILEISTHTLTWSVTSEDGSISDTVLHFNSHAHVERDLLIDVHFQSFVISTHTLTWSVTTVTLAWYAMQIHFNSHAHVERDSKCQLPECQTQNFNSHAHVERDHVSSY